MTGWQDERDREVWWELSQRIRSYHEQCLGEKPRLVRERDGYVLSRAILFRTVTEIETLPYPIEHRAQILEMLVRWARERPGLAIGTIFPGSVAGRGRREYSFASDHSVELIGGRRV